MEERIFCFLWKRYFFVLLWLVQCYVFLIHKIGEQHFFLVALAINKKIHEMKWFMTFPFLQIANKSLPTTGSSSHLFSQTYRFSYGGVLKRHIGSVVKHTVGVDFYCLMTSCTNFLFQERKNSWSKKKCNYHPFFMWNEEFVG